MITFEMTTRDELIHALREHRDECPDWVYLTAAVLLADDGRRMHDLHGSPMDTLQKVIPAE